MWRPATVFFWLSPVTTCIWAVGVCRAGVSGNLGGSLHSVATALDVAHAKLAEAPHRVQENDEQCNVVKPRAASDALQKVRVIAVL